MIENYTLIYEAKKSHLLGKRIHGQIQLSDIIRKNAFYQALNICHLCKTTGTSDTHPDHFELSVGSVLICQDY